MRREKDARQRGKVSMLKVKIGITRTEDGKPSSAIAQTTEKGLNARAKKGTKVPKRKTKSKK